MAHPCFVFKHSAFARSFGQHYILYAHMAAFMLFSVSTHPFLLQLSLTPSLLSAHSIELQ